MTKTGVVLSSGFFGFFAHAGFLASVREAGIDPAGYSGASSGAIVAAMASSGMGDDDIKRMLFKVKREDFWDPDPWYVILKNILAFFKGYPGYLKGDRFARLLNDLPVRRFEDCKKPLAISAANLTRQNDTIFTSGDLIDAVRASGAVPMLFKPVEINGSMYVDGGIVNKAPVKALADLIKPDRIFVHYISSGNMAGSMNSFLKKWITPWHIYQLSISISRQEAYQRQCELARQQGIEVVEIKTNTPELGPNKLNLGPDAYETAKRSADKILLNHI